MYYQILGTSATKLIYIANPNNPTGTYLSINMNLRDLMLDQIPNNILVVIDGAYAELADGKRL